MIFLIPKKNQSCLGSNRWNSTGPERTNILKRTTNWLQSPLKGTSRWFLGAYLTIRRWYILDKFMLAAIHSWTTDCFLLFQCNNSLVSRGKPVDIMKYNEGFDAFFTWHFSKLWKTLFSEVQKLIWENIPARLLQHWSWTSQWDFHHCLGVGQRRCIKCTCRSQMQIRCQCIGERDQNGFGK